MQSQSIAPGAIVPVRIRLPAVVIPVLVETKAFTVRLVELRAQEPVIVTDVTNSVAVNV